jgi:hypothetical protein
MTTRPHSDVDVAAVTAVSGCTRDMFTRVGEPVVLGTASLALTLDSSGRIDSVTQDPTEPSCGALVGNRIGLCFRSSLKELLHRLAGTLLGVLVDDLSGAVSPAAYGAARERLFRSGEQPAAPSAQQQPGPPVDVCAGWRADGLPVRRPVEGR